MTNRLTLIYLSRTAGAIGFHLFSLYSVLRAFEISPEYLAIGFLGLSTFAAVIIFSLLAGVIVDRVRGLARYTLLLQIATTVLALLTYLIPFGGLGQLYFAVFILSGFRMLRSPAYFALSREAIESSSEPLKASRFYVVSWQAASVVGPLLGSLIAIEYGLKALQLTYLFFFAVAVLLIAPVVRVTQERFIQIQTKGTLNGIRESVAFFMRTRVVRDSFVLDSVGVLFAGAVGFLPFLLNEIGESANHVGTFRALQNGGGILIAAFMSRTWLGNYTGRMFIYCVMAFSGLTLLLPLAPNVWALGSLFFILGALDGVSVLVRDLLLLQLTPQALQGKVYALNTIFVSSSDDLGELESGFAGHWLGVSGAIVAGGVVCIGLTLSLLLYSRDLWSFRLNSSKQNG